MKRYAEYKDSGIPWIGKIPSDWNIKALKYYTSVNDEVLPEGTADCYEFRYVDIGNVTLEDGIKQYQIFQFENAPSRARRIVKNGDVIVSTVRTYLRAVAQIRDDKNVVVSTGFAAIRPRSVYPEYLSYTLVNNYFVEMVSSLSTGVSYPAISASTMMTIENILPPLSQQVTIAAYLDRKTSAIDAVIADKEKQITLLQEKRTAIISKAVTKGLDFSVPMKDSGVDWIGQIPQHWSVSRIGFETWVRARLGWKGLKADEYVDDGYILLATPNIKTAKIDFENVNYITKERYDESPEIKLQVGDILLAKDGSTLGTVNVIRYLPQAATVNSSLAVITPYKNIDSLYLFYLWQSDYMKNLIKQKKGGMGVPHLFQGDIVKFKIPLPPKSEQKVIVDYVETQLLKVDALLDDMKQQIERLKEYRQSVISEVVTGKVMVEA